nr:immunoglobulin heavy chain junction region [Macaca mulatta]MOY28290.1 immunoglobulin heavy chain junction region [Macaca mulatta]
CARQVIPVVSATEMVSGRFDVW